MVSDLDDVDGPRPETDAGFSIWEVGQPWWTGKAVEVVAVDVVTGDILWRHESSVAPLSLAVDDERVLFHDGESVVCLDRSRGDEVWRSPSVPIVAPMMSFFAPTLVAQDGVVLFAGGEVSGLEKSGGGATTSDTLTALDADSGTRRR